MAIQRLLVNICSDHLAASRDFYIKLFQFEATYDSNWFVNLVSKELSMEIGIIDRTHEIVPEAARQNPQGIYLTFVVDDVDACFTLAQKENIEIIKAPHSTFYGQRRLLLKDPNGIVVDVSAVEN